MAEAASTLVATLVGSNGAALATGDYQSKLVDILLLGSMLVPLVIMIE